MSVRFVDESTSKIIQTRSVIHLYSLFYLVKYKVEELSAARRIHHTQKNQQV